MIDRRLFREIDSLMLGVILLLSFLGVLFIHSSSYYLKGGYYGRQLLFIFISLAALVVVLAIDYQHLLNFSLPIFVLVNLILLLTPFLTRQVAGTKGWLIFPSFRFQPSEIGKISLILLLAHYFSRYRRETLSLSTLLGCCGLAAIPFFLVLLQPDLGTAACYLPILLAALFLAGLSRRAMGVLLILALLVGAASWHFYLKDYQKKRLITVFSPHQDKQGAGYQILQSKIAIGSGGFLGKGFMKGTQTQLRFLPARHTDFIFSVISEEFGFVGSLMVILLFMWLLWRLFRSVELARDRPGKYIIFLVAVLFSFECLVNLAMVIGFFPVVGIPLPFLSYGGSSLLTHFLAVGLVLNVRMRRFANV